MCCGKIFPKKRVNFLEVVLYVSLTVLHLVFASPSVSSTQKIVEETKCNFNRGFTVFVTRYLLAGQRLLEALLVYIIRTSFREASISRFSKNREINDSRKKGYAKIKHAKFNALINWVHRDLFVVKILLSSTSTCTFFMRIKHVFLLLQNTSFVSSKFLIRSGYL